MIRKLWVFIIPLLILSSGCKTNRDYTIDFVDVEGIPVLISPENGSTVSQNPPTMTWQKVRENKYYEVQLFSDDSTLPFVRLASAADGAATVSYTYDFVLPPGVYTWKVRWAKDVNT
jgi:hypothetical protein